MNRRVRVSTGDVEHDVDVAADGLVTIDGTPYRVAAAGAGRYRVTAADGTASLVAVAGPPHALWTVTGGQAVEVVADGSPHRRSAPRAGETGMTAPMPATVVRVAVAVGDRVDAGAAVVALEAMKMELTIRAAKAGVVRAVHCAVGDLVTPGTPLVEIDG